MADRWIVWWLRGFTPRRPWKEVAHFSIGAAPCAESFQSCENRMQPGMLAMAWAIAASWPPGTVVSMAPVFYTPDPMQPSGWRAETGTVIRWSVLHWVEAP